MAIALIEMVTDVVAAVGRPDRSDGLVAHAQRIVTDLDPGALPDDERQRVRAGWTPCFGGGEP